MRKCSESTSWIKTRATLHGNLPIYFCLIEEAGEEEDKDKRKREEERAVRIIIMYTAAEM